VRNSERTKNIPLEVIRTRVFVLLVVAKRADITWRIVNKPMPYHFIFALKALATLGSGTSFDGTKIRAVVGVYVRMRTWGKKSASHVKRFYRARSSD
jgi:hypothetical protein